MIARVMAAGVLWVAAAGVAVAQIPATSGENQTLKTEKQDMNCNQATTGATAGAATTPGSTGAQAAGNSQNIEKSAILPSAGNHASSAAPTVQSGGKPMVASTDCPQPGTAGAK